MNEFPKIPSRLLDPESVMEPCPEVYEWAYSTFLDTGSELYNKAHEHLADAFLGFVWTNVSNQKSGKRVLGTCQVGEPQGGTPWAKARQYEQLTRWFGLIPAFVITLDAVWLSTARPEQICALVEHELHHAFYKVDEFGQPMLDDEDGYRWTIRPHDVEEFVGVVERYGAWNEDLERMKVAMSNEPLFGRVKLDGICGSC